jgi:hypothetical protein
VANQKFTLYILFVSSSPVLKVRMPVLSWWVLRTTIRSLRLLKQGQGQSTCRRQGIVVIA